MKYLLLTFDVEEKDNAFGQSSAGLNNLAGLLEKHKINSTFFVSFQFFLKHKKQIKNLSESQEIALHCFSHSHNYSSMPEKQTEFFLGKAKAEMEKELNNKIFGFRPPRFQKPSYSALKKLGFFYSSSIHPTFVPFRYFDLFKERNVSKKEVWEIPVSVTPFFRLPFSWFWFKHLGLTYAKLCSKLVLSDSDFINLYFHSWEFSDKKLLLNLEKYIEWCLGKKLIPLTIKEYFNVKLH